MQNLPKYKGKRESFGNCMNELSELFSHPLFERIIGNCFGENISMNIFYDKQIDQLTDAYIREDKVVYLFEFKDAIIPVKVKNSSSFNEIKAGVFEKFVYNEKDDRKKGISQLSYAIENLAYSLKNYDKNINESTKITYIPILVYTDITLDFPGINQMLNDEFKIQRKEIYKKVNSSKRGNIKEIKDLFIINFRFFVDYQNHFKEGKISLNELLDYYNLQTKQQHKKAINSINEIFNCYTSTNQILYSYTKDKFNSNPTSKQTEQDIAVLFED